MTETCEMRVLDTNKACDHEAKFIVQVGTRKYDAQRSCGQHLTRTCMVMAYGDGGDIPGIQPRQLTVTMLAPV